jgi:hypothetical protein
MFANAAFTTVPAAIATLATNATGEHPWLPCDLLVSRTL